MRRSGNRDEQVLSACSSIQSFALSLSIPLYPNSHSSGMLGPVSRCGSWAIGDTTSTTALKIWPVTNRGFLPPLVPVWSLKSSGRHHFILSSIISESLVVLDFASSLCFPLGFQLVYSSGDMTFKSRLVEACFSSLYMGTIELLSSCKQPLIWLCLDKQRY